MKIANRDIGPGEPPYIVAELSGNHGGSRSEAYEMIKVARDCGADAVKIQCYTADSLTFKNGFQVTDGLWQGKTLHELYKEAETPPEMVQDLFSFAKREGITIFATVFDQEGVDLVVRLEAPCIKISSFELIDTPLIEYAASTELPLIISTGLSSHHEIINAVKAVKVGNGNYHNNLALLHCISSYPADPKEANLPALGPLSDVMGGHHVVGFSDHTLGYGSSAGAIAFGASIIEKHFILGRHRGGPDAAFSLEPAEFAQLVKICKETWQAIQPSLPKSQQDYLKYRKSVYIVRDLCAGESFSKDNCRILRPAYGLPPYLYQTILAGVATCDLKAGTPLNASMVSTLS